MISLRKRERIDPQCRCKPIEESQVKAKTVERIQMECAILTAKGYNVNLDMNLWSPYLIDNAEAYGYISAEKADRILTEYKEKL